MSNFTQQAIIKSFLELLAERPLDKITVTDIAARCTINRNTFYYHYHDIYDLLDTILRAEEDRIFSLAKDGFSTWTEPCIEATRWASANRDAVLNIYNSASRDRLISFLYGAAKASARKYVEKKVDGRHARSASVDMVVRIVSSTIVGLVVEWLNNGVEGDQRTFIVQAASLVDGAVQHMVDDIAH